MDGVVTVVAGFSWTGTKFTNLKTMAFIFPVRLPLGDEWRMREKLIPIPRDSPEVLRLWTKDAYWFIKALVSHKIDVIGEWKIV